MQRRVPQEFVDAWDAWLQESLHATRQRLGEGWLAAYLTSPVWRFVLAEGVCGGSGYAGVMMPSVDRVGRYFPLTILAPLAAGSCVLEAACGAGRAWFDAAEALALGALEASDLDLDAFDAHVEALEAFDARSELAQSSRLMELMAQSSFAGGDPQWHVSMPAETPQRAVNAFASIELERAFRPCALWWTQGSEAVAPGWLVSRGLPAPASFAAMLNGEWRAGGWSSIDLETAAAPETASALEISAAHPPRRHDPGAGVEPRFVTRPEIGLWGIVCAEEGHATAVEESTTRPESLDRIADGAHDLAPRATLTTLVEETRRMLQRASTFRGGALFFLAQGGECALVWMGAMQAVRARGGAALPLLAPAEEAAVRYEPLQVDDLWLLGAAAALAEDRIGELAAGGHEEASGPTGAQAALDPLLSRCLAGASGGTTPAVMLLKARQSA